MNMSVSIHNKKARHKEKAGMEKQFPDINIVQPFRQPLFPPFVSGRKVALCRPVTRALPFRRQFLQYFNWP
jgi:hypothetical protein